MTTKTKSIAIVCLVALFAATLFTGIFIAEQQPALAEAETLAASDYFYQGLSNGDIDGELAKKFYNALDSMKKDGDFKDGEVEYSLSEILTSDQIKAWVNGESVTIPKAFSAARDAYLTDHPEVFYIDFYKLTISASLSGSVYSAWIDSGREASLYFDNDFANETQVNEAIAKFDAEVNKIVAEANKAAQDDQYGTNKDAVKARYVNTYLLNSIKYDDDALASDDVQAYAHSRTAYGGIVNGVAVCSGYSRAYKVVLDKLGIPCLCVSGYSLGRNSQGDSTDGSAAHEWNYVWLENVKNQNTEVAALADDEGGRWYAVDVTWNSTGNNPIKYMGNGDLTIKKDHATDGVISTSGYELIFPELSKYDYGCDNDSEGISYSVDYVSEGGTDDYGNPLMTTYGYLSYNGKGAKRLLAEDGLRMIYRMAGYDNEGKVVWYPWIDINNYFNINGEHSGFTDAEDGSYTKAEAQPSVLYSQFAVTDCEPDYDSGHPLKINFSFDYDSEEEWGDHLSVVSEVFENKTYGTYVAAPHVLSSTPNHGEAQIISNSLADPNVASQMDPNKAFLIEVRYNEPLRILDDSQDIGIEYQCVYYPQNAHNYSKVVPLDSGKMVELVDEYTLRFKFCPSLMFEHDGEHYTFSFTNVGSNLTQHKKDGTPYTSDKAPNPITFRYIRMYIWCTKCLPGGRLYVNCVAKPTLMMSNTDLSEVGFINPETDEPYPVDKRSQMMLVADRVNEATESDMLADIDNNSDIDISSKDIKASETYDIELRLCGKYVSIPNGSKVRVSLGFPEGYGPEDEGVTFRLYHYKHDNEGNFIGVEEVPCVVTQFGIVATVSSFSPYMVAVVPADKAPAKKAVYANVEGRGGQLSAADSAIKEIAEGETYTCAIAPDNGYQIYTVTLNGKDVTSLVQDGKISVNYNDLKDNNELEIKYIANGAVKRVKENNIIAPATVVVNGNKTTVVTESITSFEHLQVVEDGLSPTTIGIIIVAAVLAVCLATVIAVIVIFKKKRSAR